MGNWNFGSLTWDLCAKYDEDTLYVYFITNASTDPLGTTAVHHARLSKVFGQYDYFLVPGVPPKNNFPYGQFVEPDR